jgi:hypothetical protein
MDARPAYDAREHGLTGDRVTNETHATWTTERASGATAPAQGHRESGDADE